MSDLYQQQLLQQLSDGSFHSGEELAKLLGVSRTAVWKTIESLRNSFHLQIHAVQGRGYRLASPLELLDAGKITAALSMQQRRMLGQLQISISVDSTNSHLKQQMLEGIDSGSACLSEYQSAGRGRRGRSWVSPFGCNLYLSLYWRFERSMTEVGGVSIAVGSVIAKVLSEQTANVALKWPNDVLIDGKKIAGILVDVQGAADGPVDAVIGIGVNLDLPEHASQQIDQPWTDLQQQGNEPVSRNQFAARMLGELLQAMQLFQHHQLAAFIPRWRQYDLYHGEQVTLYHPRRKIRGIHKGISDDGSLLLEVNGKICTFQSGEVSLRGGGDE
ncbi:MAG: bifunctional biotin--[acetyl-CoA-carboxylase] ligase/biotin operon repressor BirA [Pseudomonadota bacterium]|nr:bifunctional biotin--[acetyl-CoA-carboxylase] ligase/biotin operon repressor BirA [Pseudomonadota bacterium]